MPKHSLNPDDNVIFIETLFKGTRGTRLLSLVFDTGATLTTIPKEAAVMIGCDPIKSKKRLAIITASGTEYVSIVIVPTIQFLGIELHDVEAACLDLPPESGAGGLLGLNVIKRFKNILDFPNKFLEILTPR